MKFYNPDKQIYDDLSDSLQTLIKLEHERKSGNNYGRVQVLIQAESGRSQLVWRDLGKREPINKFSIYRVI